MLVEGQFVERFGWTFDELDKQDSGRTFQTVAMMNYSSLYKEVFSAVKKHTTGSLSSAHWEVFRMMQGLQGDDDIS